TLVSRVAVCAGSGYSVVSAATTTASSPKVDVYLTGEMGHHDALAATAAGTSCILGEHSNTERGYLRAVLAERLQRELDTDNDDSDSGSVSVVVSLVDKDPISIE
ncbi:NGG1 interacting factor, partial [Coemansia sp. RSA 1804]